MTIVRTKRKRHNFSIIDNSGLIDPDLTWKETGLLAFLMTKPDDWEISVKALSKNKLDGRDSVASALKGLQKKGYVHRIDKRDQGKFSTEYLVFETKEDLQEWLASNRNGKTVTEKPERENRNGETGTENPDQVITYIDITDQLITDLPNTHSPKAQEGESESKSNLSVSNGKIQNQPQIDASLLTSPETLPQPNKPSSGSSIPVAQFEKVEQSNKPQDPFLVTRPLNPIKNCYKSIASDPWMQSEKNPDPDFAQWVFETRYESKTGKMPDAKAEIKNNCDRARDLWEDYQRHLSDRQSQPQAVEDGETPPPSQVAPIPEDLAQATLAKLQAQAQKERRKINHG